MSAERDGRRVSGVLGHARNIRSTAEDALRSLRYDSGDPAYHDVVTALERLVEDLEPFKRTGKGCGHCGAKLKKGETHKVGQYSWKYTCEVPQ